MDWDANLATIIKHTDANLEQQFRQFADMTTDLATFQSYMPAYPATTPSFASAAGATQTHRHQQQDAGSFASAFLRDSLASTNPTTRPQKMGEVGAAHAGGGSAMPSFAQHFRHRQERKRHGNQPHDSGNNNHGNHADDGDGSDVDGEYPSQSAQSSRRRQSGNNHPHPHHGGMGYQMYTSPTYDMAQMMEQVRLSLKLEVDARAAIAERQLSALLQLSKATAEELDRLRVEVCANDRQLHTLDQVQAKIRQEMTTQKDIGFHLQSMCGKDESWRMQAENQLLELRQMVAALREQGNSIHVLVQEKLSRQELLVQFNAAIEPIKAQFQATLQHQAQQLAEITRSSSSSTLLLDALTQKVNRVQSDEIVELRHELQALKVHVSRMGALDGRATVTAESNGAGSKTSATTSDEADAQRKAEKQQQSEEQLAKRVQEQVQQSVTTGLRTELEKTLTTQLAATRVQLLRECAPAQELQSVLRQVQENWATCQRHNTSVASAVDTQLKQLEQSLRGDIASQSRELRERQEQHGTQLVSQLTALVETRATSTLAKSVEITKAVETEQRERRQAMDTTQDELRRSRHALEEQLHQLACETRTKVTTLSDDWTQKLRDTERKVIELVDKHEKDVATQSDVKANAVKSDVDSKVERLESKIKAMDELATKLERSIRSMEAAATSAGSEAKVESVRRGSVTSSADAQTAQLASLDALLQKMLLQMQLQLQQQQQQQSQLVLQAPAPPYAGYWTPSMTDLSMSAPPAPAASAAPSLVSNQPAQAPVPVAVEAPTPSVTTSPHSAVTNTAGRATTQSDALANSAASPPTDTVIQERPSPASLAALTPLQPSKIVGAAATVDKVGRTPDPVIEEIINRVVSDEFQRSALPSKQLVSSKLDDSATATAVATAATTAAAAASSAPALTESMSREVPPPSTTALPEQIGDNPAAKIQQTLASTVKGAVTEAEMAKMRIEARRKQEQEARQQQQQQSATASSAPPTLTRAASASSLSSPTVSESGSGSVGATTSANGSESPLVRARSNSVSNLLAPPEPQINTAPSTSVASSSVPPAKLAPAPTTIPQPQPPASPLIPRPTASSTSELRTPLPVSSTAIPSTQAVAVTAATKTEPKEASSTQFKAPPPPPVALPSAVSPASTSPASHVLCDQCRLPVRAELLVDHMQRQCIKRTVACTSCQLKFPWHEVDAHERDCRSSATAALLAAASSTSVNDSSTEVGSGTGATGQRKCRHCAADVAATELFEHELRCDHMLKQCPHCLRRQKVAELQEHIETCDCRLVSCPNDCGGKFLQRGIDKHLTTRCPKRPVAANTNQGSGTGSGAATAAVGTVASPSASLPTAVPASPPSVPAPAAASRTAAPPSAQPSTSSSTSVKQTDIPDKVECKFCDEEYASREIDAHENNCDWKPKRCQHCNMVIIARDLLRHESSCKTSTKNCPHCQDTMSLAALAAHTSRCSKRPIKCIRCCQLFPADSIVAHSSNCKFIPSASSAPSAHVTPSTAPASSASAVLSNVSTAPMKIPPPPPNPPTSSSSLSRSTTPGPAPAAPAIPAGPRQSTPLSVAEESVADRLARRNLALSQLTSSAGGAPGVSAVGKTATITGVTTPSNSAAHPSTPTSVVQQRPELDDDHNIDDDDDGEEEEEDDEEDGEEDEDDEQMTLAQVVAEWSVENVCLWLHEDVGVPEVVPRFQQRRCNGEMLLDLTESDLINDFGIKQRLHRERILSAIDAIKTSDDFSDEEEEEEEEDMEEEEDDDGDDDDDDARRRSGAPSSAALSILQGRPIPSSLGAASHALPRDLVRRNSLPSPQPSPTRLGVGASAGARTQSTLPSSSAMLRRINSALNVEYPPARQNK